jgi:hypothetical protein
MPSYAVSAPQQRVSLTDTLRRTATPGSNNFYMREAERAYRSRAVSQFHTNRIYVYDLINGLDHLESVGTNWNSYGSPAPSADSISVAKQMLAAFAGDALSPDDVRPSAEGGVAIIFSGSGRNRAIVESLNNDEQFILLYDLDGDSRTVDWTQRDEKSLIAVLRDHLQGVPLATAPR